MVGIQTNSRKMVRMILCPCRVVVTQLEATYKWIMNGGVLIYWPRKKLRVQYTDFGADLVAGLMEVHWKTRHGVDKGAGWEEQWGPPP